MEDSATPTQRILFVENNDELRAELAGALSALGHDVVALRDRNEALSRADLEEFDVIISDLAGETTDDPRNRLLMAGSTSDADNVKAFKIGVPGVEVRQDGETLRAIIEQTLECNLRYVDVSQKPDAIHEKIDFELPSNLSLMIGVLDYLLQRVANLGLVKPERSNLFVALDEAFVNAVKHGNKSNPEKLLRITADLSLREAIFTVEDEGEGFDVREIPDPCDPANLFRTSGRGVMLMYNIMDEVEYNARGNKVKLVKRSLDRPLTD